MCHTTIRSGRESGSRYEIAFSREVLISTRVKLHSSEADVISKGMHSSYVYVELQWPSSICMKTPSHLQISSLRPSVDTVQNGSTMAHPQKRKAVPKEDKTVSSWYGKTAHIERSFSVPHVHQPHPATRDTGKNSPDPNQM